METNSKENTSKWVEFLRSEKWVAITFVFITIPLIVHTQHLMLKVTGFHFDLFPYDEELYALLFALGFDLAMITFAVNGKETEATGLAFIVFLFNSFFLNYDFLINLSGVKEPGAQLAVKIFINVSIAGTASWIVHRYVSFFNELIGAKENKYEMYAKVESLKKELTKVMEEQNALKVEKAALSKQVSELNTQKAQLSEQVNAVSTELSADVQNLEVANLKQQLASAREAYSQIAEQYNQLNDSYETLRTEIELNKKTAVAA